MPNVKKKSRCQIVGCNKFVVSHGLCDMHRQRLRKHGHMEQTRAPDWGHREKHPLYNTWAWAKRHAARHPIVDEWRADFWRFAADVGERPGLKYKLFAADETKPIGPGNFVWKLSIIQKIEGEDAKTYSARYQRVSRAIKKEAHQGYELKRRFGLSKAKYEAMLAEQDGVCAICEKAETTVIRGLNITLAVDHCHTTGRVRGLLCTQCNRSLGGFRDDPALLEAAIAYLKKPPE